MPREELESNNVGFRIFVCLSTHRFLRGDGFMSAKDTRVIKDLTAEAGTGRDFHVLCPTILRCPGDESTETSVREGFKLVL